MAIAIGEGRGAAADPYIEQSAEIMGATRWRILKTITFPLVPPTIGAGAMIVLVKALGNFGAPAILGGEYCVPPTPIYYQIHGYFNLNAASAIPSSVPIRRPQEAGLVVCSCKDRCDVLIAGSLPRLHLASTRHS